MLKKALQIQYRILPEGAVLTGIHRTDRGSKYLGRAFTVLKGEMSKEDFQKELVGAMEKLVAGSE
jgi:hypothetical protein